MSVRVAFLLLFTALAAPAAGQDMPTVLPHDYVLSDILNQQRIEASIGSSSARGAAQRPRVRSEGAGAASPAAPVSSSYRPSAAVSARVRQRFIASMEARVGRDNARTLAAALSRGDPVANWSQLVAEDGLRAGDVGDALAAYWLLNWGMANGKEGSRAQVLAVRDQVRALFTVNPRHTGLDDAQRQEIAETLMLNFLLQHAAYSDAVARGDRGTMQRLGDAAVARFRSEMGLDLRRLALGDAGFVPVR